MANFYQFTQVTVKSYVCRKEVVTKSTKNYVKLKKKYSTILFTCPHQSRDYFISLSRSSAKTTLKLERKTSELSRPFLRLFCNVCVASHQHCKRKDFAIVLIYIGAGMFSRKKNKLFYAASNFLQCQKKGLRPLCEDTSSVWPRRKYFDV